MGRKGLLGEHRRDCCADVLCRVQLLVRKPAGGARICGGWVSATTADYFGDCETTGLDRADCSRIREIERMGVCGIYLAWICAVVAHYSVGQKAEAIFPLVLLVVLYVSYVTRPAHRTWKARIE
jgi:hypothetical protein